MGSICGDLRSLTRRQLYSMIRELSRKNNCLKSDLLRHKLLSNECQKYLHFMAKTHETIDNLIENQFIKQINDLKDTQNCFIALNELPLNVLSNHFDDMFVSIGCQTSDESQDLIESDIDLRNGIEYETKWMPIQDNNSGSVDENENLDIKQELIADKDIINSINSQSMTNNGINTQTISTSNVNDMQLVCNVSGCAMNWFKTLDDLNRHQSSHLDKRFFCDYANCCRHFGNYDQLVDHNSAGDHLLGQSLMCGLNGCPFETTSTVDLEEHISHHSSTDKIRDKQFVCDFNGCLKSYIRKDSLSAHKRIHNLVNEDMVTKTLNNNCDTNNDKHLNEDNLESNKQMNTNQDLIETFESNLITSQRDTNNDINSQTIITITEDNESQMRPKRKKSQMKSIECEDNDSNTDEYSCGASDEDISDESDIDCNKRVNTSKGKYACDFIGCDKVFKSKPSLYTHKQIHMGHVYPCDVDGCSETFAIKRYLTKHKLHKHCNKYRCDVDGCGYSTGSNNLLNYHTITHSNDKKFKCLIHNCNKRFKTERFLNRHQFRVHPNELPDKPWIKCTYNDCDYKTKCTVNSTNHMRKHAKPYECDECGKRFGKNNIFLNHKKTHYESMKIQCEWYGCERLFSIRSQMKDHMNTHTAKTSYPCQWPGCDKTYLNIKSMQTHERRVHKGVKDLSCHWPECDYTTTNPIRLNNHINKQHKDLDDYKCSHPNCDFKTTKCGQMDKHMTTHSTKI